MPYPSDPARPGVVHRTAGLVRRAPMIIANRRGPRRAAILAGLPAPDTLVGTPRQGPVCYALSGSLPEMRSGYAMRSHYLLRALQADGQAVHALTRPGFPSDRGLPQGGTNVVVDGVTYHRIAVPRRDSLCRNDYLWQARDAYLRAFATVRPGLVMAASDHQSALPALLAARQAGLPFIYEVRGFWEITRASNRPLRAYTRAHRHAVWLESVTAARADMVITLGPEMANELVRRGVARDRIRLLPNACDPVRHAPRPRDAALAAQHAIPVDVPVIGYVGSFTTYEGLDLLVMACAILRRRGARFRLVLVGAEARSNPLDAAIMPRLRRLIAQHNLGAHVVMPGPVAAHDVARWYSLIDIAPFPRRSVPVARIVPALKPLEAMAMGKAVVVSNVAPQARLVADGAGLSVASDDARALADTLDTLLRDPGLRARLGRAARAQVVARHSWTHRAATFAAARGALSGRDQA